MISLIVKSLNWLLARLKLIESEHKIKALVYIMCVYECVVERRDRERNEYVSDRMKNRSFKLNDDVLLVSLI